MSGENELAGQVGLVTGGGRGVGRSIARALAGAGASVAVLARSDAELAETAELIRGDGGSAIAIPTDVLDSASVERAVRAAEEALGPVTALVNNAGTCLALGPAWEVDPEAWWNDVEVSLRGALLCSRAVLPGMIARGGGRILSVSSGVAVRASPYYSGYAAGKAGLLSFTEALAGEGAAHEIAAFAITPGLMPTAMTERLRDSPEGRRWLPGAIHGRWVEPERLERLVRFLASGRGDSLSGRFLHALDDVEDLARRAEEIASADLYVARLRRLDEDKGASSGS